MSHAPTDGPDSAKTPEGVGSSEWLGRIVAKAKLEDRDTIYCTDLAGAPVGCCISCHDDEDAGWYGIIETDSEELLGGLKTRFCCNLSNWLDDLRPNTESSERGPLATQKQ